MKKYPNFVSEKLKNIIESHIFFKMDALFYFITKKGTFFLWTHMKTVVSREFIKMAMKSSKRFQFKLFANIKAFANKASYKKFYSSSALNIASFSNELPLLLSSNLPSFRNHHNCISKTNQFEASPATICSRKKATWKSTSKSSFIILFWKSSPNCIVFVPN